MFNNLSEEDRQKELRLLKNSYDMYESDKKDMLERRKNAKDKYGNRIYSDKSVEDTLELMETMQQDIRDKYMSLGGTEEELNAKKTNRDRNREKLLSMAYNESDNNTSNETIRKIKEQVGKYAEVLNNYSKNKGKTDNLPNSENAPLPPSRNTENIEDRLKQNSAVNNVSSFNTSFDSVPLPSNGECYRCKISRMPISELNAYDENLIISPNLYKDGTFLDYLLKSKIMTNEIGAEDLLPGDRDALVLWLRATGYGPEYPISVTDKDTGEQFDTVVDLSNIKYKPFSLKGDENGYFDFVLPSSNDKIKFKFLTYKEITALSEMEENETKEVKRNKLKDYIDAFRDVLVDDDDIDRATRMKVNNALNDLVKYTDTFTENDVTEYSQAITNRMILSVMSVNNITDRNYIREYVCKMNVRDSSALRKYITENEPGLDYNITVERPESLGGGSITTFLQLDQFIFLNLV